MHKILLLILLLLFQSNLSAKNTYTKPAFIYAAGNLKFVFPQMVQKFYAKNPEASVLIQYGASGYLTNAILKGKKYHIFFSADISYPQKVYTAQKSATPPKKYVQGKLILFIPSNPRLKDLGLNILKEKSIKNITIANKANAPYGVAALELLNNHPCYKESLHKIRYSSDVATAIDNVIWHGDAGFLSKSVLSIIPDNRQQEGIDWIELDPYDYTPIIQAYVISEDGLKNKNAMEFLKFVESKEGQKIFRENGYKNINPH